MDEKEFLRQINNIDDLKEDIEYSIKDVNMMDLVPGVWGDVFVFIRKGKHVLDIPTNMNAILWRHWIDSPPGIFSKDLLKHIRNNGDTSYLNIETEENSMILRLIRNDELDMFKEKNLVHGKIKGKPYMVLKILRKGQNLRSLERYIKESSMPIEFELHISNNKSLEDEENVSSQSISLFN